MVYAMINRKVYSVEDLRIITQPAEADANDNLVKKLAEVFRLRVVQYLRGVGHPPGLSGSIVSAERHAMEAGDATLRPRMFLEAFTESELLPTEPGWKLQVGWTCER